ncbi:MAG: SET domain-containing protein [Opitutales bacterium]
MGAKKTAVRRRRPVQFSESDFEVRDSSIPNIGKGLFALRLVRPGDTIGSYVGKIIDDSMAEEEPYVSSRYLVYVCQDYWIEGQIDGNYTRFINHSTKPNAELVTSVRWKTARIKALKLIRPGDEIFFDYGEDYWEALENELEPVEK